MAVSLPSPLFYAASYHIGVNPYARSTGVGVKVEAIIETSARDRKV
jgi:hypothetical protein